METRTRAKAIYLIFSCVIAFSLTGCLCKRGSSSGLADANASSSGLGGELSGGIPVASDGGPLSDINFAYDSSSISGRAQQVLKNNAQWLAENPETNVRIEGHCDERGTNEYNMALGQSRARSVYDYLRAAGIAKSRMSVVSYGEEVPLDPGHSEEAWAKNRRAHFATQ